MRDLREKFYVMRSSLRAERKNLDFTRRHITAMCGILAGSLVNGCRREDPHDRTDIHRPNCYLRGTQITTELGEKKIETLNLGDKVTIRGGKSKSIKWIGIRRYSRSLQQEWIKEIRPVRIAKGALYENVPKVDLFVSQGHRLYLRDTLIKAVDIVNGTSIAIDSCPEVQEIVYFHLILDGGHNIIFAERAPSETLFVDKNVIQLFDNFATFDHSDFGERTSFDQVCAPVYMYNDKGQREKLRSHLRSALSPWIDRRNQFDKLRDHLMRQNPEDARYLIPGFDGAISLQESREALWANFFTGAPARLRQSVERYNIVKRA